MGAFPAVHDVIPVTEIPAVLDGLFTVGAHADFVTRFHDKTRGQDGPIYQGSEKRKCVFRVTTMTSLSPWVASKCKALSG